MRIEKYSSFTSFQKELNKLSLHVDTQHDKLVELFSELFRKKGFLIHIEKKGKHEDNGYHLFFTCLPSTNSFSLIVTLLSTVFFDTPPEEKELQETIMFLEKEASNSDFHKIEFLVSQEYEFFIDVLRKEGYILSKTIFEKIIPFPHNLKDILSLFTQKINNLKIKDYEAKLGFKDAKGVLHLFPLSDILETFFETDDLRPVLFLTSFNEEKTAEEFFKHTCTMIKWDTIKMLFSKNLSYSFTSMT